jgi:hypothetical protein
MKCYLCMELGVPYYGDKIVPLWLLGNVCYVWSSEFLIMALTTYYGMRLVTSFAVSYINTLISCKQ